MSLDPTFTTGLWNYRFKPTVPLPSRPIEITVCMSVRLSAALFIVCKRRKIGLRESNGNAGLTFQLVSFSASYTSTLTVKWVSNCWINACTEIAAKRLKIE